MEELILYIIIGVFAVTIIFALIIIKISKTLRSRFIDHAFFQMQWQKIMSSSSNDPHHAILNADKLIDKALALKGYQGTLGEKLKKSGNLFSDLNGLWSAHKLRNSIAHEIDHHVSESQTRAALQAFKKALRDLGIQI